tara:strand:- start:167 stop:1489 length:1323 start_codon:yes stop_codon:yes gene_type:complete
MMASGAPSGAALAEAKAAHEAGDFRKADRLYRRILRKDPNNAAALNLHGILASQSGDPRRAVQSLKRAVAIDGDTVDYQINLGVVLESSGDIASAYDHYASALERKPHNADLLGRVSEAAREADRYEDFAVLLEGLCTDDPDYPQAQFLLGQALYFLQRPAEAVEPFRRAAALAPSFTQAYANLASVLMDLGRPEEALAACADCLRINPGDSYALATQAIALMETGDGNRARALLDFDALLEVHTLAPPSGYSDIAAFNDALEAAVMAHPTLRVDPNHRSCHFAGQTDDLFQDPVEPFIALETAVRTAAESYRKKLDPASTLPFLANPAPRTELIGWATAMRAQGHQSAHIHPASWLSAVYYVRVPDLVRRGDNAHKGWIEFGQPPEHYPITKESDVTFIEPVEGKLILFPSYVYHRTMPYEDDALRISIAFDFDPTLAS